MTMTVEVAQFLRDMKIHLIARKYVDSEYGSRHEDTGVQPMIARIEGLLSSDSLTTTGLAPKMVELEDAASEALYLWDRGLLPHLPMFKIRDILTGLKKGR